MTLLVPIELDFVEMTEIIVELVEVVSRSVACLVSIVGCRYQANSTCGASPCEAEMVCLRGQLANIRVGFWDLYVRFLRFHGEISRRPRCAGQRSE